MLDKPFKTYDEQVEILRDKYGLVIYDKGEAVKILATMSYYDLINGYKECFMVDEKYSGEVSLDYLYIFHHFDRSIQSILFKYSIYVEKIFKTGLSYVLAQEFGVTQAEYLDSRKYSSSARKGKKIAGISFFELKKIIENVLDKSTDNPVKFYRETKNHIPPWILVKNLYFDTSIKLYQFLGKLQKERIADNLIPLDIQKNIKTHILVNALNLIRRMRNVIAHNGKLITFRIKPKYALPKEHLINGKTRTLIDDVGNIGKTDLYAMILSLVLLLNDTFLIAMFMQEIEMQLELFKNTTDTKEIFATYAIVSGLPLDLINRFNRYLKYE